MGGLNDDWKACVCSWLSAVSMKTFKALMNGQALVLGKSKEKMRDFYNIRIKFKGFYVDLQKKCCSTHLNF